MPKECPMCGGPMRMTTRTRDDRVPGTAETHRGELREWICPECDYFEEVTTEDDT